ncbi:MAG: YnfA family protein [Nitrososphaeraceae archaeon]
MITLTIFGLAALFEIGGGYLIWLWLREKKSRILGVLGGIILFIYGIILTFQPETFGRVYATYGGIFIISSLLWGLVIDKKKPDKYEIIGSVITIIGVSIIFYAPR